MKPDFLCRLPMIPRLTALTETPACRACDYLGWELLEVDDSTGEILICKPCEAVWEYTRAKHLLILGGEVAVAWERESAASLNGQQNLETGSVLAMA